MADAVVSFGLQKLWDLLSQESQRFTGIQGRVTELRNEVDRLKSFVKDAEAKKQESESVRNCLEKIKDIVYDAEDVIEAFVLKEGLANESGPRKRLKRLKNRWKADSQLKDITDRIAKEMERLRDLGIRPIVNSSDHSASLWERLREARKSFPHVSETDLVGLEHSTKEVTVQLVENISSRVVSICGMGGIGKTTLARRVFHHEDVRRHFERFAWVCVSKQCRQSQVWQEILSNLSSKDERQRILQMSESELAEELHEMLKNRRCLVVLDDVWQSTDWDLIKPAIPQETGSKILLTSRNDSVASHADPRGVIFKPKCLTFDESLELLQRIALSGRTDIEFTMDEVMEDVEQMIKHCGGLPLAVKTLGGLLATKCTASEWRRVNDNIRLIMKGMSNDEGDNQVFGVVSLSYEDLPIPVKDCFLYLAHYPEDYDIDIERLFNHWVADGIVELQSEEYTIRDVAEVYLETLVNRNMVLVSKRDASTSRIIRCRMHDVMRDFCLSRAKEENFLEVVNPETHFSNANVLPSLSANRSRRLAVHVDGSEFQLGQITNPKLRSLVCIHRVVWLEVRDVSFGGLPSLRVLDLPWVQFPRNELPESIGKLIHLRHLSLSWSWLSELPSCLGNLTLMVFLDLRVHSATTKDGVHVPNVLKKMKNLRYLVLPSELSKRTKMELGDLVKLETLRNFSTRHSSLRDLVNMTRLRSLSIIISRACDVEVLPSLLSAACRHLEDLSLTIQEFEGYAEGVQELVSGFPGLIQLELINTGMRRLPNELRISSRMVSIELYGCGLEEDPMLILEKMQSLKKVSLNVNAFEGRRMVCSKGGFLQLHTLKLGWLENLEEWVVEEGSMPRLCRLHIFYLPQLKMLPDGLRFITSLKQLKVDYMRKEFTDKLVPGGEDHYKVQHIPSVKFFYI